MAESQMHNYRWRYVVSLLFAGSVINYMDRSAFGIALPLISKDFGLSPAESGILLSSFFAGYALFNFVGGYLSDLWGPKNIMAAAMVQWSAFCGATAATFNFTSLLLIRFLFGVGEGPVGATLNKTVSNWFPLEERASAVGIAASGQPIGGALAGPIAGLIALRWGWKASFVVLAFVGFVWVFFWWRYLTDYPSQNPRVSPEEKTFIEENQPSHAASSPAGKDVAFTTLIRQPAVLFTALAFFSNGYVLYFFLSWFPSYLVTAKHLSIKEMSVTTVVPWVLAAIGMGVGGKLSDYIYHRTGKLMFSRKIIVVVGLMGSAVVICLAGSAETANGAVAMMAIAMFLLFTAGPIYWVIISDNIPIGRVGAVGGFIHFLSNGAGVLSPTITGFIIQYTGHFTSAFIASGAVAVTGALGFALFVKPGVRDADFAMPIEHR